MFGKTKHIFIVSALILVLTSGSPALGKKRENERRYNLSLSYKDASLKTVTDAITQQAGVAFSYDNLLSDYKIGNIVVALKDADIDEILSKVFTPVGISYRIVNRIIILNTATDSKEAAKTLARNISGTVRDDNGEPLVGVSVYIRGSEIGTTTKHDGRYSIEASPHDVLSFSFLGFEPYSETIGKKSVLDITMHEEQFFMDEVVVVGYGTARKKNILGAIETLSGDQIINRPSINVARSIQGMIPGLNIIQTDGKANHSGKITIRGVDNSFNARITNGYRANKLGQGGNILVLIDGAEGDMSMLNPDDIASFSILKDASSAAVYGARGALGVILITTRNPEKGKTKITYNGSVSFDRRTILWEDNVVTDPVEWVEAWRESYMNSSPASIVPSKFNNYMFYSDSWFDNLRLKKLYGYSNVPETDTNTGEYSYFGHTNWLEEIFKKYSSSTSHALSIQGGREGVDFYASGRYFSNDGIYKVGDERYRKYNFRVKGNVSIRPWLKFGNNTNFMKSIYHQPMVNRNQHMITRMLDLYAFPFAILKNPDGSWTETAAKSGYASFAEKTTWQEDNKLLISNTSTFTLDIIPKILSVVADFTYKTERWSRDRIKNKYSYHSGENIFGTDTSTSSLDDKTYKSDYISSSIVGTFTPQLGKWHSLSAVIGWNIEDYVYKTQRTYKQGNLFVSKPSFTLMDGNYYITSSGGYTWGLVGAFIRADYSWKKRYLLEFSARYDGSSKFPENSKWGFFPSASAGWRISDEPWIKSWAGEWLNNLKLRTSIGALGNANIDPYQYLETMSAGGNASISYTDVVLNGKKVPYTSAPKLVPDNITWEKVSTYDIGVDSDIFNDRLSLVFDLFWRKTSDLYTVGPDLPQVLGSSAPSGRYASLMTNGWEFSIGWKDSFRLGGKRLFYNIKGMIWDSRSKITSYYNQTGDLTTYYKGMNIGEIWGFRTDGIYSSNADADAGPDYSFFKNGEMFKAYAGDLKFKDIDHNGKITPGNRTLSNHGDLTIIGNQSPRMMYSVNMAFNWNGIGLSMLLQGVGKRDWYPWTESGFFWGKWNRAYNSLMKSQTGDNRVKIDKSSDNWTVSNLDKKPYWTRMVSLAANRNNGPLTWENDHYLQDASYIRLKNLTIDYTFNPKICRKLGLSNIRVYFSGDNLLTWSPMFKHTDMFDPEVITSGDEDFSETLAPGLGNTGNGYSYPMLKTFTIGINLTL